MNNKEKLRQSVKLHRSASDIAGKALAAQIYGDQETYLRLTKEAFVKEARSAELMRHDPSHHMYAILHRSAATLAYRCGEYKAAEQLIVHGLIGEPNDRLREELYELLAKVRFRLSLNCNAPPLADDEIILTWQGAEADNGLLDDRALADLVKQFGRLVRNTAAMVLELGFHNRAKVEDSCRVFATLQTGGSFKINLKLLPFAPAHRPAFEMIEHVKASILRNLERLNNGYMTDLQSSFADSAYFHDFMQHAKELAPDEKRITALAIEAGLNGERQSVLLTRTRAEIENIYIPPVDEPGDLIYHHPYQRMRVKVALRSGATLIEDLEIGSVEGTRRPVARIVDMSESDQQVIEVQFIDGFATAGRYRTKTRDSNRRVLDAIKAAFRRRGIRSRATYTVAPRIRD